MGAQMATITNADISAYASGCWAGHAFTADAGLGFPNRLRVAPATAEIGFQVAIVCSHPGMPWVGTKHVDTNDAGKSTISPTACADSGSPTMSPITAVNQLSE